MPKPDADGCWLKVIAERWERLLPKKDRREYYRQYYDRKTKPDKVKMNRRRVRARMHLLDKKRTATLEVQQ